jgi:long-chain fatty acid transport protein
MRKLLSLTLMTLATSTVFAGGYRVSIQGQKQLAMGHTGVAVVNSAEVAFFNPAGMSFLDKKFNLSVGGNALFAKTRFQENTFNTTAASDNLGTPFSVYATYKINDWLSAGLAVYTPYGSSVEWDQNWQGAYLVNNIDLISIKIADQFSIGGGPIYATGGVNFNRNLFASNTTFQVDGDPTDLTLDAQGVSAWGYNLGFMFNPTDKLRLGFNYRSEIILEARDGDATFKDVPSFATNTFENTTFNADLPLPAEVTSGLSYQVTDKLLLAFDYNYTIWSVYKSLDVSFAPSANSTLPASINPRNYKNASAYRVGAQYMANDKFTFRAGWYIDESPVQNGYFAPETPRNDGMGFTGGLTYQLNDKFGIDASFLYLQFDEITNSYDYNAQGVFKGTYKSSVFSPGVGITYGF